MSMLAIMLILAYGPLALIPPFDEIQKAGRK